MKTIKILDIINTDEAILRSFGIKVFESIKKHFESGEEVTLSFDGLKNVNFPFFTALIGNLYKLFPDKARTKLHFEGINDSVWQDELNEALHFALNPDDAKIWNNPSGVSPSKPMLAKAY